MAPLFSAYDRSCYQKLVPSHIADIQCYPNEVHQCFKAGGFTVKLKSAIGHAVALDEAHEMSINRDMKMAEVDGSLHKGNKSKWTDYKLVTMCLLLISPRMDS